MNFIRIPVFLGLGMRKFTKGGYNRASRNFPSEHNETEPSKTTVMITGGNQGIGFAAASALAKKGCHVYIVCRNEARGVEAVDAIKNSSGNPNVHLLVGDVSSLGDIRRLASQFRSTGKPLNVLINNAGVMVDPSLSKDGYELNFATNTLGSYAMARAFEPILKASAAAKVIFVASGGALTEPLEVNDLQGDHVKKNKSFGQTQYARDKRRQIAIVEHLSKEWSDIGVYSMHPGWVDTQGVQSSMPDFYSTFHSSLRSLEEGADTIVWLATRDKDRLEAGAFYLDREVQSKHLPLGGTGYTEAEVATLMQKLNVMIQPALLYLANDGVSTVRVAA